MRVTFRDRTRHCITKESHSVLLLLLLLLLLLKLYSTNETFEMYDMMKKELC